MHKPNPIPLSLSLVFIISLLSPTLAQSSNEANRSYTDDKTFQKQILDVSNTYRQQHNATGLKWNETLVEYAKDWSEGCEFKHSGGPYGENLASGYPNASASIIAWGHERVDYDFKKGEFSKKTGHFTQLVWKLSTSVGCAATECNTDDAPGWYVVCEYYPPGNVIGAFTENVQEMVPQDQQPEGPDDPSVPDDEEEECMLGAKCGGVGGRLEMVRGSFGAAWVALVCGLALGL